MLDWLTLYESNMYNVHSYIQYLSTIKVNMKSFSSTYIWWRSNWVLTGGNLWLTDFLQLCCFIFVSSMNKSNFVLHKHITQIKAVCSKPYCLQNNTSTITFLGNYYKWQLNTFWGSCLGRNCRYFFFFQPHCSCLRW